MKRQIAILRSNEDGNVSQKAWVVADELELMVSLLEEKEAAKEVPTRAEIDKLNTISHIIENWIFFDKEKRDREGLETTDDTHIMSPPTWPSHGQLKEWVKVIRAAKSGGARFTREELYNVADEVVSRARPDTLKGVIALNVVDALIELGVVEVK